ncbi:MAG: hypothetical protein HC850_18025 [Rhodomicrobium sp.]|nr:hypothetical protein [Rhodomicrobium sp.]
MSGRPIRSWRAGVARAEPVEALRDGEQEAAAQRGADQLADYVVGGGIGHHRFCKTCGVRVFATGYLEQLGGDFAVVFLNTLDDVSPEDFGAIPIKYADGRNDNWWNEPAVTSYL